MDRLLFLHIEIKHVLDIFDFIPKNDRIKLLATIANMDSEKLLEVLKLLYKIERDYFQYIHEDIIDTDNFIKSLKLTHDK